MTSMIRNFIPFKSAQWSRLHWIPMSRRQIGKPLFSTRRAMISSSHGMPKIAIANHHLDIHTLQNKSNMPYHSSTIAKRRDSLENNIIYPNDPVEQSLMMQKLAIQLLSLESTSNYGSTQPIHFMESHRHLMKDAVSVIRFFTHPDHRSQQPLSLMEEAHSIWTRSMFPHSHHTLSTQNPSPLSGGHIAYSILKNILLPHILSNSHHFRQGGGGNLNEITVLIDLCYGTIQSLSTDKSKTLEFNRGQMSEELLRMLLTCVYIPDTGNWTASVPPPTTTSNNKATVTSLQHIQNRLIHTCNLTMNVWTTIASSKRMDASMAKDAALHAERLLLEMVSTPRNDIPSMDRESVLSTWTQPDVISFNTVIKAWAHYGRAYHYSHSSYLASNPKEREKQSLAVLDSIDSALDEEQEHGVDDSRDMLQRKRRNKTVVDDDGASTFAAERAEAILKLLEEMADHNNLYITPDTRSYDNVIEAWAKISHIPEAPKRAMDILDHMILRYNNKAQTRIISERVLSNDTPKPMKYTERELKDLPPFPNKYTFTSCLKAWLFSKDPGSLAMMEALIGKMSHFASQGFKDCEPDIITYNILLTKYGKRLNGNVNRLTATLKQSSAQSLENRTDKEKAFVDRILGEQHKICQDIENLYEGISGRQEDIPPYRIDGVDRSAAMRDEDIDSKITLSDTAVVQRKLQPDKITHGTFLYCWITYAQSMLTIRKRFNVFKYDHKLQECATMAEKNLEGLIKLGVNQVEPFEQGGRTVKGLNVATFKEIMEIYIALGELDKSYKLFVKMVEQFKPGRNVQGFEEGVMSAASLLIAAFAKYCENPKISSPEWMRLSSQIESILNMTTTVKSPTTDMYSTLFQMYIKRISAFNDLEMSNALLERSELLYQAMEAKGASSHSKPNKYTYSYLFQIIAKSDPRYAADRALDLMAKVASKQQQGTEKFIDIVSFNTVLQLLHLSGGEENASRCKKLLTDLERGLFDLGHDAYVPLNIELDRISYSTVMSVYADLPNSFQQVQDIFDSLQNRYQKAISSGDAHKAKKLQPDVMCYNIVIGSLLKSNTVSGTTKAFKLLEELEQRDMVDVSTYNLMMHIYISQARHEEATGIKQRMKQYFKSENRKFNPTEFTFSAILNMSNESNDPVSLAESEQLLREREIASSLDSSIKVSGFSYNAVIKKYIKAVAKDWETKVSQLLNDMIRRHEKLGEQELPSKQILVALNTILKAIRESGIVGSAHRADTLLRASQNKLARMNIRLDSYSYSLCMDTWAISRDPLGPRKNFDILNDLISHYNEGDEKSAAFLFDINSFNLVLKACALCPPQSMGDETHNNYKDSSDSPIQVAMRTFALLQNNPYNLKPNHLSYSYMIECCSKNLSRNHPQRDTLIEKLFNSCCNDGHLSNLVLSTLKQHGSRTKPNPPLRYLRLEEYPRDYRRNVKERFPNESKND